MGSLQDRLQPGRYLVPKLIVAIADYGEYSKQTMVKVVDGKPQQVRADRTPDGKRPIYIPWILERALLCRSLDWKYMPEDLDEKDVTLRRAVEAITIFEACRQAGDDLAKLSGGQQTIVAEIYKMRDEMERAERG